MPLTSPATPAATPIGGVVDAIAGVVLGRRPQIELCVAAAVTGNHVLLDDEPGVGKTTLAKALAITLGGSFARIQGTVDLLPGDLTGVTVVDPATGVWSLRPGPLLNDVVLVDEVNRISPRTQSALLEAMAERQVTIDGTTHPLAPHFVTIATMNPRGSNGTFVLTEGQVDRFGVVVSLGGADSADELDLLRGRGGARALEELVPLLDDGGLAALTAHIAALPLPDPVASYTLALCDHARQWARLSTRAPLTLASVARGWAVLRGRSYVAPDDVRDVAHAVLAHRLAVGGDRRGAHEIIDTTLAAVAPPRPT